MRNAAGQGDADASARSSNTVRDAAQRRALFELDYNIQALRGQMADNEAVLGLTGHHHNLVRAWSEV